MNELISFLKKYWPFFIIIFLAYLLLKGQGSISTSNVSLSRSVNLESKMVGVGGSGTAQTTDNYLAPAPALAPAASQRLTVKNSSLSLLVKDVSQSLKKITVKAEELGGYFVDSNLDNPEGVKSGNISVRIPAKKLDQGLNYFRNLSIRVVSENLTGYDITDQYTDIQARLDTLNQTKAKFEEILNKATAVQDILDVQRNLISLQDEIDSLKGQEKYLKNDSEMSLVTIYLSTDELSLPYSPSQPWRAEVIFKSAVRGLVLVLRGIGTLLIWIVVFSIIWLPVILIYRFWKKRHS